MSANSFPEFMRSLLEHGLEFFGIYYGTYRAVVVNNNDPTKQGKLKIRCEAIHGSSPCEVWAWPIAPWASKSCGLWIIPDVGDSVYVVFDHGRADAPLWFGGWWAKGETTADMVTKKVVLTTKEGMKVVLDREAKSILVEQTGGNSILMTSDEVLIKHKTKITMTASDVAINGRLHVVGDTTVDGKFTLNGDYAQQGNGNVNGNWYATNNSAHHTHPVVLGVAVRNDP